MASHREELLARDTKNQYEELKARQRGWLKKGLAINGDVRV